jgi:hypothetical protein
MPYRNPIDIDKYANLRSDNEDLVVNFKSLNFDELIKSGAVRVTHQGMEDGSYNPDPKAGFSLVSAYNDAVGKGTEGTNLWKDNPEAYGVVKNMFENEPTNIGKHKYLQIVNSAKDLGLAEDQIYKKDAVGMATGGAVKDMNRLFAEGGMNDEGGTVDPVSGNDVPAGSLQNEVRDDIPAQLSEGEFVVPADVVRYIGLERLMKLRDEAKAGLARMNEIGQMGNAEEVENPEALHEDEEGFDSEIDDIMKEVDGEATGEPKYASGGVVRVPPADKDILAKYNIQRTSITNPALDVRLLKNAAGDSLYMTYFNNRPGGAIPEGYSVVDANPASRMGGTTTTAATTATVNKIPDSIASVDSGNKTITTVGSDVVGGNVGNVNNASMVDLALGNVAITGKDGKVTTVDDGTTTDGGMGVNAYGGNITSDAAGGISAGGVGGTSFGSYTLNADGTVTPNTVSKGLTLAAGIVNPILGAAARINNAFATSAADKYRTTLADTAGINADYRSAANTAGPTGSGGTAASAATNAGYTASSMGLSAAAAGAASQAAADAITRGKSADQAAEAGRAAAAEVAMGEKSSTEVLAAEEASAAYRESLGDFNELDTGFSGSSGVSGGSGGGGSKGNIEDYNVLSLAKGGLVAKRTKKPTLAQKRGIASKK